MRMSMAVPWPRTVVHDTQREGVRLGIILATTTWVWLVVVDALLGQPFHTFDALGGVVVFTVSHYLLNILYGIVLVSVVHGAKRAPSLMFAMVFGTLLFETAMAMLTAILAQAPLGGAAWLEVFVGSVVATTVAILLLARSHPLVEYLHQAEDET